MVGKIEGNDDNYALFQGHSIEDVKANVLPDVIQVIKDAVTVVVPGNFPIDCLPIYLTIFHTNDSSAYDEHHCLKDFNSFSTHHNEHLKQAIQELQKDNLHVAIVDGDYYNAFSMDLASYSLDRYEAGFDPTTVQKACCGIGGEYNFNPIKMCGASGVPAWPDPDKRIRWDGVHLTQKAYRYISGWVIDGIFPKLHMSSKDLL